MISMGKIDHVINKLIEEDLVTTEQIKDCIVGYNPYLYYEEPVKFDSAKTRPSVMPWLAIQEMNEVMELGAKKYGLHNYIKGEGFSYIRLFDSCMRHLTAFFWNNEEKDPESGKSHLAHAAANCLMLLENIKRGKGIDDRLK